MNPGRRWTLAAAILGSSIVFLDGTILTVALPRIGAELPASLVGVLEGETYVVSGYLAILAAFLVLGGALSDRRGRRRTFVVGLVGFGLASALCGLAPTMEMLVAARLAQGIAGALLVPGSLAVLTATFEGAERARAFGWWAAATSAVAMLGPIVGGVLVESAGWRSVFLINVPLVAVGTWLAVRWIAESSAPGEGGFDWLGAIVATVAVGGLVVGIIRGPERDWQDGAAIVALLAGVVATVAFPILMLRRPDPLVPLGMFRDRRFATVNLSTLLVYGALYTMLAFSSLFLQGTLGYSPLGAALAILPVGIALTVLSAPFGTLAGRIGTRGLLTAGPIVMAGSMAWWAGIPASSTPWRISAGVLASYTPPADTLIGPALAMTIFGVGIAMVVAPLTTTLMGCVPVERAGIASAINNAVSRVGQPFLAAAVVVLVGGSFQAALGAAAPGLDLTDPAVRAVFQPLNAPPPGSDTAVVEAVQLASTEAFHVAAWLCAALLALGGLVNWWGLREPRTSVTSMVPGP